MAGWTQERKFCQSRVTLSTMSLFTIWNLGFATLLFILTIAGIGIYKR